MAAAPTRHEFLKQETDRIEWKSSDRDLLQAVCALANDLGDTKKPGYVLLGIDKSGTVAGFDSSDESQQRIANRLSSIQLLPHPSVDVRKIELEGRSVLLVTVAPYPVPPIVRLDQIAWVRVGTTTRRATEADLTRLQERRPMGNLPFDQRPVPSATLEDLNLDRLRSEFQAAYDTDIEADTYPSFETWLGQRDVARLANGRWRPTGAGLLCFGTAPHQHLPGATIEFARFVGADLDSPLVERKTIFGSLPDQLEALWGILSVHLAETLVQQGGVITLYRPEYPPEALRELARNLVQHRLYEGTHAPARVTWFSNTVVFSNPGSRFGRASEGEFGAHSDYRNPTVTRLLVENGYVERLGRGIRLVRNHLERNGNPPLELETDGFTTVTLRRRP